MNIILNIPHPKNYVYGVSSTNDYTSVIWQESNTLFIPSVGVYFALAKSKLSGKIRVSVKFVDCNVMTANKVVILSVERFKLVNKVVIKSVERVRQIELIDSKILELYAGQGNVAITLPYLVSGSTTENTRILTTLVTGVDCYSNGVKLKKDNIFSALNEFVINVDNSVLPNDFFVYFGIKAILSTGNTNEAYLKGRLGTSSNELNQVYILIGKTV